MTSEYTIKTISRLQGNKITKEYEQQQLYLFYIQYMSK